MYVQFTVPCYFTIKASADLHILRVLCIGAPLLTVVKTWGKSNTATITVRVLKGDISSFTLIMGLIYLLHPSFTSLLGLPKRSYASVIEPTFQADYC